MSMKERIVVISMYALGMCIVLPLLYTVIHWLITNTSRDLFMGLFLFNI